MALTYSDGLPIGELASAPERVLGAGASDATLHYCSPAHGGWGVVRTALLIPESYLLFVCPAACGRHGAIAAFEQGFKDRVGYLCLEDEEISLGTYQSEMAKGIDEALSRIWPKPKALLVCVSCIDDLLGTDHEAMLAEVEARHGIPTRLARMNPITIDGPLPPPVRIQKTMYEFLSRSDARDSGVNLLGCFSPLAPGGDLEAIAKALGAGPLRHPGSCADFGEFLGMARSRSAVLVRPEGRAAAAICEKALDIRVASAPVAYSRSVVGERLARVAEAVAGSAGGSAASPEAFVRKTLASFSAQAAQAGERAAAALEGAVVAVDSTASASPFDMALALAEAGIAVGRVYAEALPAHERQSLERLAELSPQTLVINPSHWRRHSGRPEERLADIAVGFAAGYATSAPRVCPLAFDEGMYGHAGRAAMFAALERCAASDASSLEEMVSAYGLVV